MRLTGSWAHSCRRASSCSSGKIAMTMDAALRSDPPNITLRAGPVGTLGYLAGTRLAVWEVVSIWRDLGKSAEAVARRYDIAPTLVLEALAYAENHPEEIEAAIEYSRSYDLSKLRALLPDAEESRQTVEDHQP